MILVLMLYIFLATGALGFQFQVTKLQYGSNPVKKYQEFESRGICATVEYQQTGKVRNKQMHIQNGNLREKGNAMTLCY